ncbi:hypothetical protein ACSQ67_009951 [Phaseolus vulgaris]
MKDVTVRTAIDTSCGSVEYQLFLVSYLHGYFLSHQTPLTWLIAPDALSHGRNLSLSNGGYSHVLLGGIYLMEMHLYSSSGGFCAFRWILGIYLMRACLPILFTIWLKVTMLCNVN